MGIEYLINQISAIFDLESSRRIISSLHQDQIIWKSLESIELSNSFVTYASDNINRWTAGHLVRHVLINNNFADVEYSDLSIYLPETDKDLVSKNFQTTKQTLLPPNDLIEVGLLALYLREYRINNGYWKGVNELFNPFKDKFKGWSSVLAALPAFIPDIESFFIEFLSDQAVQMDTETIHSVVHALLSNPIDDNSLLNIFHNIFSILNLDTQIRSLYLLNVEGRSELSKVLAEDYLQLKVNLSFFSNVLTKFKVEDFRENYPGLKIHDASLVEIDILQKLATLYHYAEKYKNSSDILALVNELLIQNQAKYLNLSAKELANYSPEHAISNWESALKLSPIDEAIILNYTDFLIETGQRDRITELLLINPIAVKSKLLIKQAVNLSNDYNLKQENQGMIEPIIIEKQADQISQSSWDTDFYDTSVQAAQYYQSMKSFRKAQKYINQALERRPNDIKSLKLAAELHLQNAELNEALEKYTLVRILEPGVELNHINLVDIMVKQRQYQKAFSIFEKLFSSFTDPTRAQLLKYADLAEKAGKTEIAIPICKKLLSLDPLDGEALITLGNAHINSGQETLAIEIMEKAAAIAPDKPESWIALAKIWSTLGARDRVLDSLQKARIALPAEPIILNTLGKAYLDNELATDALPLLKEAYQLNPENLETKTNLADALQKLGFIEEAWQLLKDLETEYTSNPHLAYLLGILKYDMGDFREAHQFLKFAWRTTPTEESTTSYSRLLLNLKEQADNSDLSKIDLELSEILTSLEDESDDQLSFAKRLLVADIKNALGQHQNAYNEYINLLNDPASKSPRMYSQLQYKIGKSSLYLKLNEEGLAALQEAVMTEPNNHHFRKALAEAYLCFNLDEDAKSSAKAALQISPHDLKNILWYSNFMLNNGEPQKAIASLKDAIFQSPNNRELYISLSRLYISMDDYVSAKSILNEMVNLQDVSVHEMANAANIFYYLNDFDKASSVLSQAISKSSQKSFWDLDEIIRALLLIGEIETAKELIIENEVIYSPLPEFQILKSDVLIASNLLSDASACLSPLINKMSYSPNLLNDNFAIGAESDERHDEYSPISIYIREIQLERLFGDYRKVSNLIEDAERIDPNNSKLNQIQLEAAFSLQEREKFVAIIQNVKSSNKLAYCINCLQSIIDNDYDTAASEYDKHLNNEEQTSMTLAIQACLELHYGEIDLAQKHFDLANENLSTADIENTTTVFSIEDTYSDIWSRFAQAIASWKLEKWEIAEYLFEQATSQVKINPYINFVYTEFLVDLIHKFNISEALNISTHKPSFQIMESAPLLYREQISYAKQYLSESLTTTSQKIADIIFTGQLTEKNNFINIINNEHNAALLLSVMNSQEMIKAITSAFPMSTEVQFQHALNLIIDNPIQSLEIVEKLLSTSPGNPKLLALVGLNQTVNLEQRIAYFEKALSIWPDEPEWHAIIAADYAQLDLNDKAEQHLEKAISLNPQEFSYYQLLGEIKKKENDFSESKLLFTKAFNLYPENPEVLQGLALINRKLGKYDSTIECYESLIKLDPLNITHQVNLANTYLDVKDYDKALEISRSIVFSDKNNLSAREIEIKAQLEKKNSADVKKLLEKGLTEFPDHLPFMLLDLDATKMIFGNDAALRKANSMVQTYPEDPSVLMALANCQVESGQLNNAELTLHRILELNPDHHETLVKLGRINRINGNLDHAVDLLSQVIKLDMTNMDAYIELGKTYQIRRQHEKAIEIYHKAISIIDNDFRPYLQAGIAYKECKDYRNAETMLRKAATLAPMETSIRRQLASVITLNLVNSLQEAPNRYEQ